ncbi:L-seryl-tRNA(Sec) selenium transferase, partial [Myxococcota bacterium]|nr:L-seryl-tRNA(Sec) selenium transferase [Myxococcota bacterium]
LDALLHRRLGRAINATGVLLHTNLGRAPLGEGARAALAEAAGWTPIEIDLDTGLRGHRAATVEARLCALTGAEAALVVNNCAAAVLLTLTALTQGREVLVSRGELVEIGGGFRVPAVLAQSGARLVEVGTTNRTHLRDYQAAITPQTAAILKVHSSNFKQIGFVTAPPLVALAGLGLPLIVDLGSGATEDEGDEPTIHAALSAGAVAVCVSGDKLLGGPQAGIILGAAATLAPLRRHPLMRALRPGKLAMAALEGTLHDRLTGRTLPLDAMRRAPLAALRAAAEGWRAALAEVIDAEVIDAEVIEVEGAVGGGSLPGARLPSIALALRPPDPEALRRALLGRRPPVIGRLLNGALLLDARTIAPLGDGPALLQALREALDEINQPR